MDGDIELVFARSEYLLGELTAVVRGLRRDCSCITENKNYLKWIQKFFRMVEFGGFD